MLPMWKSLDDVKNFLTIVDKRVKTTLLLETKEAVECLDEVLENGGFDEIHIGLNDLHLSYHLKFMFELLANGTVEKICNKTKTIIFRMVLVVLLDLEKGHYQRKKLLLNIID